MADDSPYSLGSNRGYARLPQMGVAGWLVGAGVALLLLPLLPFLAVYYLLAGTDGRPD
ncbi:DUF7535 family protein [Halorarum halobium]|uniref:DUF7535 family protein n=1 Tax=Halorarum halobium TaxID=3075121 RepID=UPI0028AE76D2|nr:hypothetical protein [Halobaculum sp. XH14]